MKESLCSIGDFACWREKRTRYHARGRGAYCVTGVCEFTPRRRPSTQDGGGSARGECRGRYDVYGGAGRRNGIAEYYGNPM